MFNTFYSIYTSLLVKIFVWYQYRYKYLHIKFILAALVSIVNIPLQIFWHLPLQGELGTDSDSDNYYSHY